MKKILFPFFLILSFTVSQAQYGHQRIGQLNPPIKTGKFLFQLGGGWNYSPLKPEGANYVIRRFNATRNNTNNPMPEIEWMHGPTVAITAYGNTSETSGRFLADLHFTGRSQKVTGFDSNTSLERELKINVYTVGLGGGTVFVQTINFDMGIAASIDFNTISSFIGEPLQERTNASRQFILGATVFMPIFIGFGEANPLAIAIRPFYQYQFKDADFAKLNQAINPTTYQNDDLTAQQSRLSNYGVEVQIIFVLKKKLFW